MYDAGNTGVDHYFWGGRPPTDIQLRSLRVQGTATAVIVILGIVLAAFLAL